MADVTISEYSHLARDAAGNVLPAGLEPALAEQKVTIAGTSAQSAAFNANTTFVRVYAEGACSIAFGTNPTADTTLKQMAAGQSEFFGVVGGHKLAVIS